MKKLSVCLLLLTVAFSACKKTEKACAYSDSPAVATAAEISAWQSYFTANSLTPTQASAGFFYSITAAGSGSVANICSSVTVRYTGKLSTGATFDSNATGVAFNLGDLIIGWQKGIPLIARGGSIRLYIPPSLGYGNHDVRNNAGVIVIPANSYLIFDIQLDSVN